MPKAGPIGAGAPMDYIFRTSGVVQARSSLMVIGGVRRRRLPALASGRRLHFRAVQHGMISRACEQSTSRVQIHVALVPERVHSGFTWLTETNGSQSALAMKSARCWKPLRSATA